MARERLVCEIGPYPWERETKRGRKPRHCPNHQAADSQDMEIIGYVDVPITLRSSETLKEAPQTPQEPCTPGLVTRGRRPSRSRSSGPLRGANGPGSPDPSLSSPSESQLQDLYCENGDHDWSRPPTRGRKPVNCPQHPNAVERDADAVARRKRAEDRIDKLEFLLRLNGTHISQHQPKEVDVPNRAEWKDKAKGSAGSLKGSRRTVREAKRNEAEARNAKTLPERRSRKKVS